MYVLYTDDSILAGPDSTEIDKAVKDIQDARLDITIEGDIQDFLGVNIERKTDGIILLTQPHLIDQVLEDLRMPKETKTKDIPAPSSKLLPILRSLTVHLIIARSWVSLIKYLEKGSRPDIAYAVHQCARFSADPKQEHGEAIRWLARYLKGTQDKGMILHLNRGKQLEVYVDADFAGNWDPEESDDRDTARSRH
jgi:hypothetical protein